MSRELSNLLSAQYDAREDKDKKKALVLEAKDWLSESGARSMVSYMLPIAFMGLLMSGCATRAEVAEVYCSTCTSAKLKQLSALPPPAPPPAP